jgi:hypothetical protein
MAEMSIRRSQIRSGTANKIVGNDANGKLTELSYVSDTNADWSNSNDAGNFRFASQHAVKQYVNSQIASAVAGLEWQDSCLDARLTPVGLSPVDGDRYLINGVGVVGTSWQGHDNNIAEYQGSGWIFTPPTTGMTVSVDTETTGLYYYTGSAWTLKVFGSQSYTWGDGLTNTGSTVNVDLVTNGGLWIQSTKLGVKPSSLFKVDSEGIGFANSTTGVSDIVHRWTGSAWETVSLGNMLFTTANGDYITIGDVPVDDSATHTGIPDGIDTYFYFASLTDRPGLASTEVFLNGVLQLRYTHYTLSAPYIIFTDPPLTGDVIMLNVYGGKENKS